MPHGLIWMGRPLLQAIFLRLFKFWHKHLELGYCNYRNLILYALGQFTSVWDFLIDPTTPAHARISFSHGAQTIKGEKPSTHSISSRQPNDKASLLEVGQQSLEQNAVSNENGRYPSYDLFLKEHDENKSKVFTVCESQFPCEVSHNPTINLVIT